MPSPSPIAQTDLDRMRFLSSRGWNPNMPNSYASQQALREWDLMQGQATGLSGGGQAVGVTADQPPLAVGNVSSSGIDDPAVRNALINQVLNKPTENVARNAAIDKVNALLASFSPDSIDTNAILQQAIRKANEAFAPGMTRGMQAAGQSGSSMQALMSRRAASDAAESAAMTANQAKMQMGGISASLAGVLEGLTKADYGQQQLALSAADLLKTSKSNPVTVDTTNTNSLYGGGGVMAGGKAYQDWLLKANGGKLPTQGPAMGAEAEYGMPGLNPGPGPSAGGSGPLSYNTGNSGSNNGGAAPAVNPRTHWM